MKNSDHLDSHGDIVLYLKGFYNDNAGLAYLMLTPFENIEDSL
jgi:hypothetical protein